MLRNIDKSTSVSMAHSSLLVQHSYSTMVRGRQVDSSRKAATVRAQQSQLAFLQVIARHHRHQGFSLSSIETMIGLAVDSHHAIIAPSWQLRGSNRISTSQFQFNFNAFSYSLCIFLYCLRNDILLMVNNLIQFKFSRYDCTAHLKYTPKSSYRSFVFS